MPLRRIRSQMKRVLILAVAQFLVIIDETSTSLLAPLIAGDFDVGAQARQILVTPFAAAFVCALPLVGVLLRRVDPRIVVAPAVIAFGLTAAAGAVAPTLGYLVAARVAQGFAAAVAATCILAALHLITRRDSRRIRAFAVFSLVSGSGAVAALLFAGALATYSWRWCFWVIAVASVSCGCVWAVARRHVSFVRESPFRHTQPSAGAVVRREVLTRWTLAAVVAANAVLSLAVITVSFALQLDNGWTATWVGVALLPANAAAASGALLVAASGRRLSGRRLLAVGLAFLAMACAGVALTRSAPVLLLVTTIPMGLGVGLVFPIANQGTLETASDRPISRAAALGVAQQIGLAAGALVAASRSGPVMIGMSALVAGLLGAFAASGRLRP